MDLEAKLNIKSEIAKRKLEFDSESLCFTHQLNVLKRIYDRTVCKKNQDDLLLKKRQPDEYIESIITIDMEKLNHLAIPIQFFTKQDEINGFIDQNQEEFKILKNEIVKKFYDSNFQTEFIEMSKIMLKVDQQLFQNLVEAVITGIDNNGQKLKLLNIWLKAIYTANHNDYRPIFKFFLEKLDCLRFQTLTEEFSKRWDEFVMVILTEHANNHT